MVAQSARNDRVVTRRFRYPYDRHDSNPYRCQRGSRYPSGAKSNGLTDPQGSLTGVSLDPSDCRQVCVPIGVPTSGENGLIWGPLEPMLSEPTARPMS